MTCAGPACRDGPARVAPHVADKILNHQSGTISGVAAVYQRHDFLSERRQALDLWGRPYRHDSQRRSPRASKRAKSGSMSAVLPRFRTILEAADLVSQARYAGVPDLPVVSRLWKEGLR